MKNLFLILILTISTPVLARVDTTCHTWPMNMAKIWLQDNNIVKESLLEPQKTQFKLLSSEEISKGEYTDIYFFSFFDKKGQKYDVISQNISSDNECSISDVNFYLVSKYEINY